VLLAAARFRPSASSRTWLLVQSFSPVRLPRLLVPRYHLAVGHFLGCVAFSAQAAPPTVKRAVRPLFEFRRPPESCPTRPSQPAAANRHLSWAFAPYSTRGIGGPLATGFACPLRSVLRVWLPSRRLTPSEPLPVFFRTGGALGIRPSELPPLGRYPPRFRGGRTHVPFHPSVFPPPKRWAGPTGRGSWALTLPGVPGGVRGLTRQPLAAPLGFTLPGYSGGDLA